MLAFGIEYLYSLTIRTQCHPIPPRVHPGIPAAAAAVAAAAAPAPAPADAADCAAARTPSLQTAYHHRQRPWNIRALQHCTHVSNPRRTSRAPCGCTWQSLCPGCLRHPRCGAACAHVNADGIAAATAAITRLHCARVTHLNIFSSFMFLPLMWPIVSE